MLRQLHYAKPRAACDFWYVGSHCNIVAVFKGIKHLREGHGAAFVVKAAIVGAGAPNSPDIQPLGSTCIDLAVAVTRDQHLGAMAWVACFFNSGCHEMVAMLPRDDDGHF